MRIIPALLLLILATCSGLAWAAEAPPPAGHASTAPAAPAPTAPVAPAADAAPARRAPRPTVGRVVLYRLKDRYGEIVSRPALVVRVWDRADDVMPLVQLQVFADGSNDGPDYAGGIVWKTSVHYDESGAEGTWHWMPYQLGQAAKNDGELALLRSDVDNLREAVALLHGRVVDLTPKTLG